MFESDVHEDEYWMSLALQLAAKGRGHVEPNPMVGCVLVKNGSGIATGYHHQFGDHHAEVDALQSMVSPNDAQGATAYVSLEPCCHHGKTPPCSEALIRAGVSRVVVAMRDPFPKVDGGGIRQLREAGIDVKLDVLRQDALSLNAAYLKRVTTGLPWVIAKWAMTVDGKIATVAGQSQWISGPTSRQHVHQLRARVDAIIVGMGTVTADDPMLNARLPPSDSGEVRPARLAKRVVLCHQRLPSTESKLIASANDIPTWLITSPRVDQVAVAGLEERGAVAFRLETDDKREMVRQSLQLLGKHAMTNVMVEAGPQLMSSLMGDDQSPCLIDECHVYVGAKLFGGQLTPGPIAGPGVEAIEMAPLLKLHRVDHFDDDVRMIYRLIR